MDVIKPMLASASTKTANRNGVDITSLAGTHTFDLKLDGLRAIAYWDGRVLQLLNRSGIDITVQFPEITGSDLGRTPVVLDGEIVADDGKFQTVATRGKLTKAPAIKLGAAGSPCRFVAFDLLSANARSYVNEPYVERRARLDSFPLSGRFTTSFISTSPNFLQQVAELGMEGVIAKRNASRYTPGGRNGDWIKFKNLHRITAIAVGYEPGTGARSHFGAMQLALLNGDKIVPVGRVGTGFSDREIADLKARLDAGTPFAVEIEILNVTADSSLRFPVYMGIRSDLSVLDCTLSQLETIPRC